MARDDEVDLNEAAAEHIRELDEHLEKLKRQNEALDALAEEHGAEMEQLKRMLAEAAERFGAPERREDAPPE
jgi:predicted RNase H-like nuclease (RuvC/YqgF family)